MEIEKEKNKVSSSILNSCLFQALCFLESKNKCLGTLVFYHKIVFCNVICTYQPVFDILVLFCSWIFPEKESWDYLVT